jgi:hypothetical protein
MNPVFERYPGARRPACVLSFVVGLTLGATQVGYAAAAAAQPAWLTVALAVYAFLAATLGIMRPGTRRRRQRRRARGFARPEPEARSRRRTANRAEVAAGR